jgi:hypothetical protein
MQAVNEGSAAVAVNENIPDDVQALVTFFDRLDSTDPMMRLAIAGSVIGVSLLLLLITRMVISRRVKRLEGLPDCTFKPLRWQRQDLIAREDMRKLWVSVWRGAGWLLGLLFTLSAITGALMTTGLMMRPAARLINLFADALVCVWQGLVGYLPELVTIIVIIVVARFFIRILGLIFDGIQTRRINLKNFYPDWSRPVSHCSSC